MLNNGEEKAVFDSELEKLLKSLGVYEDFIANKKGCEFCGNIVSEKNLSDIFPFDHRVCFCCNEKKCVDALTSKEQEYNERSLID